MSRIAYLVMIITLFILLSNPNIVAAGCWMPNDFKLEKSEGNQIPRCLSIVSSGTCLGTFEINVENYCDEDFVYREVGNDLMIKIPKGGDSVILHSFSPQKTKIKEGTFFEQSDLESGYKISFGIKRDWSVVVTEFADKWLPWLMWLIFASVIVFLLVRTYNLRKT